MSHSADARSTLEFLLEHDKDDSGTIHLQSLWNRLLDVGLEHKEILSLLASGGFMDQHLDYTRFVNFVFGTSVPNHKEKLLATHQGEASAKLQKRHLGFSMKYYADKMGKKAAPMKETQTGLKKVLCVIDVQDGYDHDFLASLPDDIPGGIAYVQAQHPVRTSYELVSGKKIKDFATGERNLTYDKTWNRGLNGEDFCRVAERCVQELRSSKYDLVVFTYDFLEKRLGEERGVFALDDTAWSDPCKPVAHVSYDKYLTINSGGVGTDISRRIRSELPEVTNARGAEGKVCGMNALYFRKQVDDAFDDDTETSDRTMGKSWLDDVDVDDNGLPQPGAETLLTKLTKRGFGPNEAVLSFCGVVTNRCVASSLLHAVHNGYSVQLLEGGCCAYDTEQHRQGVEIILEKGGDAVDRCP